MSETEPTLTEAEQHSLRAWWEDNDAHMIELQYVVARMIAGRVADALRKAESAVISAAPSRNAELDPHTGQEDPGMAAYVEGFHDAHAAVAALVLDEPAEAVPVTTDHAAQKLAEMRDLRGISTTEHEEHQP